MTDNYIIVNVRPATGHVQSTGPARSTGLPWFHDPPYWTTVLDLKHLKVREHTGPGFHVVQIWVKT